MPAPENNEENRRELVEKIISGWDVEDLYKFVVDHYVRDYELHPPVFHHNWEYFKDSYDWSEKLLASVGDD